MSLAVKRIILILLAAAAVYLAGNSRAQLWDRDEPRYAECSRQMLQSGDWVTPRLYDKLRTQKPPLIYWCQAACMKLLGEEGNAGAFAARMPSVLAMLATLSLLAVVLCRRCGGEQAMWTILILASSVMTIVAAKICLTDGVLTFFIIVCQLCLFAVWRGNRSWWIPLLAGVMLGLGGLIKGPFILGIVGCTAAALGVFHLVGTFSRPARGPISSIPSGDEIILKRSRNYFRAFLQITFAALIAAAIVLPWVWLIHRHAPEFLPMIFKEAREHAVSGKEGHHFWPGYHLLMVWPMFLPWSLLLPLAIVTAIKHRAIPEIRFALAAIVGPWIMVECIGTKLPHYFLAAYPAMAFLTAFSICRALKGESAELSSKPFLTAAVAWAVIVAAVGWAPWLAMKWYRSLPWGAMSALAAFTTAYGVIVLFLLLRRRYRATFWTMGLGMLAAVVLAYAVYVPRAQFLRMSIQLADVLKHQGARHLGDVRMLDYKEPSLGFYQGGTIREESDPKGFLARPLEQWPRWVVLTREVWGQVPPADLPRLKIIASFDGWAYADRGRREHVMVIKRLD